MKARQCPSCHGRGGEVDIICDGQGPFEECGFCRGTGQIRSKRLFYQILGWESWTNGKRKLSNRLDKTLRVQSKHQIQPARREGVSIANLSNRLDKEELDKAIKKVIKDYGKTIKLLGDA